MRRFGEAGAPPVLNNGVPAASCQPPRPQPVPVRFVISSLAVAAAVLGGACRAPVDDRPRPELEGDVDDTPIDPVTGVGGAPGASGSGGLLTTGNTTVGVTVGVGAAGGQGGMPPCSDLDEPNDSEEMAPSLGAINDCDGNGALLVGALDGPGDADWYQYEGSDDFGCVVDPDRAFTANASLRLCKFADCDGVSVTCEGGSQSETSPGGKPGCCHTQGFSMAVGCDGISDDATVFFRFDQAGSACVEYSLEFHY